MKLREILKNISITELRADPDTEISGVCYDSRLVRPGDLFVAIKGFEADGHRYIPMALQKGAAAVLCERLPAFPAPCVRTEDARLGLALASRDLRCGPRSWHSGVCPPP